MVIPVLEANEGALVAIVEVELGQALVDLGNRVVLGEVQPAVVTVGVDALTVLADAPGIRGVQHARIRVAQRPALAIGQSGVGGQRPVLIDIEGHGVGLRAGEGRQRDADGQQAGRKTPVLQGGDGGTAQHACHLFLFLMVKRSPHRGL
ncbi:hypothetical protein D3C76_1393860 [compost metagenome]